MQRKWQTTHCMQQRQPVLDKPLGHMQSGLKTLYMFKFSHDILCCGNSGERLTFLWSFQSTISKAHPDVSKKSFSRSSKAKRVQESCKLKCSHYMQQEYLQSKQYFVYIIGSYWMVQFSHQSIIQIPPTNKKKKKKKGGGARMQG